MTRHLRPVLHILTILPLLLICLPVSANSAMSSDLQRVLDHSPPDTELSVILTLEPSRDIRQLSNHTGRQHRSERLRTLRQATRGTRQRLSAFLSTQAARVDKELWLIHGLAITAKAGVIARLEEHPEIASLSLNRTYALPRINSATFPMPGWNLDLIGARDLWSLGYRGEGTVVAVLDSGVDLNHPDLRDNWRGTIDQPQSGWFDPYGLSALPSDLSSVGESFGHGTAVTGLIVAGEQSGHALGVAPATEWIAARIFDNDGRSTDAVIIAALQWAMDPDGDGNPSDAPDIVNASWGLALSGECLSVFRAAIQQLRNSGIAVTAAAGNNGPATQSGQSPANYPEVLAIGASDELDLISDFSSRGPASCDGSIYPDLVAPGSSLTTTDPLSSSGYLTVAGTSFSTAQATGALALLMEAFPDAGIATLEEALRNSAVDLGTPGADNTYGYGRLNALAAYDYLTGQARLEILDSVPPGNDRLVDFASIPPGQSAEQQVVLRNAGGGQLQISDQAFSGQADAFTLNGDCAGTTLFSGESCSLEIRFAPEVLAEYQASLQILSDDPDEPELIINVVGTGNTPPPAPQLEAPADGALVSGPDVVVSWFQSADADGDGIGHELFWVPVDSAITPLSRSAEPPASVLLVYAGAGGLLLLMIPAARCRRPLSRAVLIALLITLALLLPSCGGGGGGDERPRTSESFTLSGLESGVTYEWWVVAEDSRGGRTASATRTFQVE